MRDMTFAEFKSRLHDRLEGKYTTHEISQVLEAFTQEATDCVSEGYKVRVPKLVTIVPAYVRPKKKGEMVRNPATGEMAPRAESKPASFRARAKASPSMTKAFPSTRTKAGQNLERLLTA